MQYFNISGGGYFSPISNLDSMRIEERRTGTGKIACSPQTPSKGGLRQFREVISCG